MAVEFLPDAIEAFVATHDGPVVMVNLLRFAKGAGGMDARESYQTYLREVKPSLRKVGAEIVYGGSGAPLLVAEPRQDPWDAVLLVRYPSSAAFVQMASDPEYRRIAHLRSDAIREMVLLPTSPWTL